MSVTTASLLGALPSGGCGTAREIRTVDPPSGAGVAAVKTTYGW
jgi:hypothetical protein